MESEQSTRPILLIVDDDEVCLDMLEHLLGEDGYQLQRAANGDAAIRLARRYRPHLILLDVMMPEMDGYAVCGKLRDDPLTRDLAVVFISSLQDSQDRVRGIELGAVDFISKPFDGAEIRARAGRQVQLQVERRELQERAAPASPEQRIRQIISDGENDRTEFKSTLRWSLTDNRIEHGVEIAWLKSVAAFLNTDGGRLVVGVDDTGLVLGIEKDGFENEDKYLLHVNNRLQQHIGLEQAANARFGLHSIDDKRVLLIECAPAGKPVFLVDAGQESFYIRVGPGTRKLTMSQMLAYVLERDRG